MDGMETTIFGAFIALGGGVITYLLREIARLRGRESKLMDIIYQNTEAMKAFVESTGGAPVQVKSHPIRFGSGDWTCVVGELEDGSRMVTLAKWRDGAIAEEYIWI